MLGGSQAVKARDFDSLIVGSIPARSASREGKHVNTLVEAVKTAPDDKPSKTPSKYKRAAVGMEHGKYALVVQ